MNVSVIGLGRLGLPFSFFLASKGHKVLCFDKNLSIRNQLNQKKNIEPDISNYIKKFKKNVFIQNKINSLISNTKISFIVLPTPSNKDGSFSNSYIFESLDEISLTLRFKRNSNHIIVITSTVSPGSCDLFVKYLEKKGFKNKIDFSFVYNPHFIAQGTTLKNLEKPDLILIGTSDDKTKKIINNFYNKIYKKKSLLKNTNFQEGEISKIAINCYITTKISFSNYISELSESIKNVDAKIILDVIGQDKRINHSYMKIGTKFSGPCFPRDNLALINFSKKKNVAPLIPISINKINSKQSLRIIRNLKKVIKKEKRLVSIGLFGLTYKSDTNLILGSQGASLINEINKSNMKIKKINIFDKFLTNNEVNKFNKDLVYFKNKKDFIENSNIIIIMYPSSEEKFFKKYKKNKKIYIFDCWRSFNFRKKNLELIEFGKYYN